MTEPEVPIEDIASPGARSLIPEGPLREAHALLSGAAAFQREADAAGYGRQPAPGSRTAVTFHHTGMTATLSVEVAVVAQREPRRRCESCHKRRVLYALTFTDALMGNPDHPWRCAPCWGLR